MKDTSSLGNLTQGMVLAGLLQANMKVLTPFGDGLHYDLLIDDNGKYMRVQCKTGRLRNGAVLFNNYTVKRDGTIKKYGDTVDAYGVYCPDTKKVYLVPAEKCSGNITHLRETPAKNGQKKAIRSADCYVIAYVDKKQMRP